MAVFVPSLESDEDREEREYEEYRAKETRRRPDRKSGWAKGQPSCKTCKLFIATHGSLCSCGFDNGLGRYRSSL